MRMRLTLLIENDKKPTLSEICDILPVDDDIIVEKIELLNGNEKIIDGLSRCSTVGGDCEDCPYYDSNIDGDCVKELMRDAMEALR